MLFWMGWLDGFTQGHMTIIDRRAGQSRQSSCCTELNDARAHYSAPVQISKVAITHKRSQSSRVPSTTARLRQWPQHFRRTILPYQIKDPQQVCQRLADHLKVVPGVAPAKHHADWDSSLQQRMSAA